MTPKTAFSNPVSLVFKGPGIRGWFDKSWGASPFETTLNLYVHDLAPGTYEAEVVAGDLVTGSKFVTRITIIVPRPELL